MSTSKTTVVISEALAREVKALAAREQTTMRELIEEGLRKVLAERKKRRATFMLRDATVGGDGMLPELEPGNWEQIRDLIYKGRGS